MLTSNNSRKVKDGAKLIGIDHFITKPIFQAGIYELLTKADLLSDQ